MSPALSVAETSFAGQLCSILERRMPGGQPVLGRLWNSGGENISFTAKMNRKNKREVCTFARAVDHGRVDPFPECLNRDVWFSHSTGGEDRQVSVSLHLIFLPVFLCREVSCRVLLIWGVNVESPVPSVSPVPAVEMELDLSLLPDSSALRHSFLLLHVYPQGSVENIALILEGRRPPPPSFHLFCFPGGALPDLPRPSHHFLYNLSLRLISPRFFRESQKPVERGECVSSSGQRQIKSLHRILIAAWSWLSSFLEGLALLTLASWGCFSVGAQSTIVFRLKAWVMLPEAQTNNSTNHWV